MASSNLTMLAAAGLLGVDAALSCGCSALMPCDARARVEARTEAQIAAALEKYPAPVEGESSSQVVEEVQVEKAVAEVLRYSRWVEGNTLVSTGLPEMRFDVHQDFAYAGSTRYELIGEVAAEAFLFVDADEDGVVQRKLTFIFEGALPDSDFTYGYTSDDVVTLGGREFLGDVFFAWGINEAVSAYLESDTAIHDAYLSSAGYTQPNDLLIRRLVHIANDERNAECIVAYAEDMGSLGYTQEELGEGGQANALIPEIEDSLRERALASFSVETSQ